MATNSEEEIDRLSQQDLDALAGLLGDKAYFFGDMPSKADAAVFGARPHPGQNSLPPHRDSCMGRHFRAGACCATRSCAGQLVKAGGHACAAGWRLTGGAAGFLESHLYDGNDEGPLAGQVRKHKNLVAFVDKIRKQFYSKELADLKA